MFINFYDIDKSITSREIKTLLVVNNYFIGDNQHIVGKEGGWVHKEQLHSVTDVPLNIIEV